MRWIVALAATSVTGCASIGAPPGGPARTTPPVLLSVTPDSGAVNVRAKGVVFTFDVVMTDRGLDAFFLISPRDGRPRIRWRRERIEVRPRRNFRPNTAYSVVMLPGLSDLRGNVIKTGRTIAFSTGPTIPPYLVLGKVFDWPNERVAPKALIEVLGHPDSLLYVGVADSTGQFGVGPVPPGEYTVKAIMDANNNGGLDAGEAWDSLAIVVGGGTSAFVELLAAPRDTVGPRLLIVTAPDSVTLTTSFDRPVPPDARLTPASFRVVAADSTPLHIHAVRTRAQMDSAKKAAQDSAARSDTTPGRARRDTVPRRREVVIAEARPSKPPPIKDVTILLDSLTPVRAGNAYRVIAIDIPGLLGRTRTSERVITLPRARPDSARAPGAGAPPRPPAQRP